MSETFVWHQVVGLKCLGAEVFVYLCRALYIDIAIPSITLSERLRYCVQTAKGVVEFFQHLIAA